MDCKLGRAVLVLVFVTVGSGVARATDDSAKVDARNLAKAAKRDFDAGHFEDAEAKFRRAYALAKVPTLALWTARVLVKRGQFVAGSELYRQAAQLAPNDLWVGKAQVRAQADAKRELEELQPRIPRLRIHVQGASASEVELAIDDIKIAGTWLGLDLPADPGRHRVVGKRAIPAVELAVDLIDLSEGESKDAFLKFHQGGPALAPAMTDSPSATDSVAKTQLPSAAAPFGSAPDLTANPLSGQPSGGSQPVYAKWWFWTGVGAVAIAGAVTAFVLVRHPGNACSGAPYACAEVK
jgi:hypothetical protein